VDGWNETEVNQNSGSFRFHETLHGYMIMVNAVKEKFLKILIGREVLCGGHMFPHCNKEN
jgi:hypothetical protein